MILPYIGTRCLSRLGRGSAAFPPPGGEIAKFGMKRKGTVVGFVPFWSAAAAPVSTWCRTGACISGDFSNFATGYEHATSILVLKYLARIYTRECEVLPRKTIGDVARGHEANFVLRKMTDYLLGSSGPQRLREAAVPWPT